MFSGHSEAFTRELIDFALTSSTARKRWHITRVAMYRDLEGFLAAEKAPGQTALAISHSGNLIDLLGLDATVQEANYPEFDITRLTQIADASVDYVVSDQVLEHIHGDPFDAFRECARVTKPGGFVIHTTCFFNLIHQHPTDYWRFTPNALRLLCETAGLETVRVSAWGNKEAWAYMSMGYRMNKIPEDPANPLFQLATRNDKKYPLCTWVVARRPLEPADDASQM
jgi:SAM-dependent methyltransferase